MPLSRRAFLAALVAGAAACRNGGSDSTATTATTATSTAATDGTTTTRVTAAVPGPPFTLGVASGDPEPTSVILWTRLAPEPLEGGGMPEVDVDVDWEVAADEDFGQIVVKGTAPAKAAFGHSVHVEAGDLVPATAYWYRFRVGEHESPVGRTRTTPEPDASPEQLNFAFASCQAWEDGYYTPYVHMAQEDLDLVVFLGDYIYESGVGEGPAALRQHDGPEPTTLEAYRNRYALYKGDPDLQAVHAAFPWLVVWDDHEVENNYAGANDQEGGPEDAFLTRRAMAYQAWYEHQPVRIEPPTDANLEIHRSVHFGDLATFHLLDTRQYRSDQPCDQPSDLGAPCAEVADQSASLLGANQEAWLEDSLRSSSARWDVLAQQVVLSPSPVPLGALQILNLDAWDGYPAARSRLLDVLAALPERNPVVITGDIHASGVADVFADAADATSAVVVSELVGTSISSGFPPQFVDLVESAARASPGIRYYNARQRGYVRCQVTPERWVADYRLVESTATPESGVITASSWQIQAGTRGVQPYP